MRLTLTVLIAVTLAACLATREAGPVGVAAWQPFPPSAWQCAFRAVKQLSTERDGERREITALAQVTPDRVRLIAVSPVGVTLFELIQSADGTLDLRSRLPLPDGFDPRWVLRDFQQLHAPLSVLQDSQGQRWQVTDSQPGARRIERDGGTVVEISYGDEADGGQFNHLVNHEFGYRLSARTLEFAAPDTPGCARVIR